MSILTLTHWSADSAPSLTDDAHTRKQTALELAAAVAKVTTPAELQEAVHAKRALKDLRTMIEADRKAVKAPVIALGKAIDATAEDFMADATKEELRLDGHINHYQRAEIEKREAAERAAAAEAKRIADAQAAAERERLRLVAEAARLEHEAKTKKQREAAEAARKLAEDAEDKALDAALAAESAPSTIIPAVEKPAGLSARVTLDYDIAGRNDRERKTSLIHLATAYPDLVDITVRRADILTRLNRGDCFGAQGEELPQVPGLVIRKDIRTSVR